MKKEIENALYKRATGFETVDESLEYVAGDDDELKLSKKKISKKFVAPDISAAKALIEIYASDNGLEHLSDDELEAERLRLISLLKEEKENEEAN